MAYPKTNAKPNHKRHCQGKIADSFQEFFMRIWVHRSSSLYDCPSVFLFIRTAQGIER